jgi:hypothetical protein
VCIRSEPERWIIWRRRKFRSSGAALHFNPQTEHFRGPTAVNGIRAKRLVRQLTKVISSLVPVWSGPIQSLSRLMPVVRTGCVRVYALYRHTTVSVNRFNNITRVRTHFRKHPDCVRSAHLPCFWLGHLGLNLLSLRRPTTIFSLNLPERGER